ncbi:alpha/beta hydrolase [Furfurilactobacillus sp. WILCCON 0119]|uniref:alpha/beta hydrolase n=1 Tax=Furfurilactobacillus entadae TaxID=2922307 RepID=UPI0035E69CB4
MSKILEKQDIVYDQANELALDVYADETVEPLGTLIDIHGGGWFRGDKEKDRDWATRLANDGFVVIVPNYRITPAGHYPDPLTDMDHVMTWLKTSPYNNEHVGVVGSSAGGNMAVEMGLKYGLPTVSLSGILDIDDWLRDHQDVVAQQDTAQDFVHSASSQINQTGANDGFYKWFVTNYFDGQTDQYTAATPAKHVSQTAGPMYLANSLNEFVPTSGVIDLVRALNAVQVPTVSRFLPGSRHAKGYLDDVYDETLAFLKTSLKK